MLILWLFVRLSGALRRGGPPRERFSRNRPRADWVNIQLSNCGFISISIILGCASPNGQIAHPKYGILIYRV